MKKVILVEAEDRKIMRGLLALAGYKVVKYKDGESALGYITKNGHEPFVLVGPLDMGNIFTAKEMQRCLVAHAKSTGLNYGMVVLNVPDDDTLKAAIEETSISYTTRLDGVSQLTRKIDAEFKRIEGKNTLPKEYQKDVQARMEKLFKEE